MEVIEREIVYSHRGWIKIYAIGDIHAGSIHTAEAKIKNEIESIRGERNSYIVGIGDLVDCIIKDDPRFDMSGLAPWVLKDNIIDSQREWIVELFKPVKDKIITLLSGNHEENIHLRYQNDIMHNICNDLGVPWGGYSCFIDLLLKPKGGTQSYRYTIHAFHGAGAAVTEGARLMRLKRLIDSVEADIYLMGHLHSMSSYLPEKLALRNHRIKSVHKIAVTTGSWLRSYTQGMTPSYSEKKGYPPSQIGAPCILLHPDTGEMKLEMP
jgi:predicted phosphodiesterase